MNSPVDWKDARSHREPEWPLMGYAPGNYMGKCIICRGQFINMDKRAYHCLPCAIDKANGRSASVVQELQAVRAENATLRAAIRIVAPHTEDR